RQDVAPVPATDAGEFGLGDLATSHDSDRAVVTWTAPASGVNGVNQAAVWPAGGSAFGPVETLSGTDHSVTRPRAAFDYATDQIVVSWTAFTPGASPDVDVTTRPAP